MSQTRIMCDLHDRPKHLCELCFEEEWRWRGRRDKIADAGFQLVFPSKSAEREYLRGWEGARTANSGVEELPQYLGRYWGPVLEYSSREDAASASAGGSQG